MAPCRDSGDQKAIGWDLAGGYTNLHTVVGLRGDSNPDTIAKFTFIGDARKLSTVTVKWRE